MSRVRMEWDWPPPRGRRPSPEWQEEGSATEQVETPSRRWRYQQPTKWTGPSPRAMKVANLYFRSIWFLFKMVVAAVCGVIFVATIAVLWLFLSNLF